MRGKTNMIKQWRVIMVKDDCIFCKLANGVIPTNSLYEDDVVRVIFDASPASKGHVLIIPKQHFDNVYSLDDDTAAHIFKVAVKVASTLKDVLNLEGLNIVQNNGEIAGQTVFHFHMHIIPRYKGDTVNVGWKPGKIDEATVKQIQEDFYDKVK
jgi:histidine triad (HIT) family protein